MLLWHGYVGVAMCHVVVLLRCYAGVVVRCSGEAWLCCGVAVFHRGCITVVLRWCVAASRICYVDVVVCYFGVAILRCGVFVLLGYCGGVWLR